jgi:hypothetical protein
MMTEKEAWEFLAELWDSPQGNNTKRAKLLWVYVAEGEGMDCNGICDCLASMRDEGLIDRSLKREMTRRITMEYVRLTGRIGTDFLFPTNVKGAKQRAELCRRFAQKCGQDSMRRD